MYLPRTYKILIVFLMSIAICVILARTGYSVEICKVISPSRFSKLHSFPVNVVVQFGRAARSGTFRASLNGIDITSKFQKIENGMRALIGPEDGLKIDVKTNPQQKINVLRTSVKGLKPEQDADFDTFFFIEVGKLITLGLKGGVIQSLDGRLRVDIPKHALSSTTTMALTKVRGIGQIKSIYQFVPEGVNFNKPVTVTMKYPPANLPIGVIEDDLFILIMDNEFPRKLENHFVDKTAHAVSGTITSFCKIFMSYYTKIGKKLTDIPIATDFRLPIGDSSDASYACGKDYQSPAQNDLGETLTLLDRSSYPDFDYPKIIFNENREANTWQVIRAYGRDRHIDFSSARTRDRDFLYREDKGIFSNGEDWVFVGHGNDHQDLPIHAIADGLVIYNGWGYGNTIVLAHQIDNGPVLSVYSHVSEKSPCAVGTVVHKGNVIGKMGRIRTEQNHFHFGIGSESLIKVDAETGEIKVPATWFEEWRQDSVYNNYFDPSNFLLNIMGKYIWNFNVNGNDEGWIAKNAKRYKNGYTYQVREGMLSVKPTSSNPKIVSYPLNIAAEPFDSVIVRMRGDALSGHGKVYFATDEEPQYSEDKAVEFAVLNDGKVHEYRVFVADHQKWKGAIVGIRIDFPHTVIGKTTEVNFDSIGLGPAYLSRTPDTGLTKCYDHSRDIACPAQDSPYYGQDAHYAINPPSYEVKTINGYEVVIDHVTGLTWQRDDDGTKRTWLEAVEYCEKLALAGYSDWRLPTKKELQSIANYSGFGPVLDTAYFPYSHLPDDCYWSASTRAFLALSAWEVCLWNSEANMAIKSNHNYVRAVRGRSLEFGRFRDNGDGTVMDMTTGLMWQQEEVKAVTWEEALAYCENLDLAGYRGWRLPNIRELLSLVDDIRRDPSINTVFFPGCRPSIYWSSTTHILYPGFAWYVKFNDGRVHGGGHKGRRYYVRAVRGGE